MTEKTMNRMTLLEVLSVRLNIICKEVEKSYNLDDLSSGLYADYAKDVSKKFTAFLLDLEESADYAHDTIKRVIKEESNV